VLKSEETIMKKWTVAAVLLFLSTYGIAQNEQAASPARKPCQDLKAEIAKKLDAKNVISYTLDIVDKGEEADAQKVVGSCDGGTKSIVYNRTTESQVKSADAKKPQ
jgi:hypothetical protein